MNRYLGAVIILLVVGGGIIMGGGLERAIDLLLIFVIGVGIGHALGTKDGDSTVTRFGRMCTGGWLGLLVGITLIAGTDYAARWIF